MNLDELRQNATMTERQLKTEGGKDRKKKIHNDNKKNSVGFQVNCNELI